MKTKATFELHFDHDESVAHPEALLHRTNNLLAGQTIKLPGHDGRNQFIKIWAVTLLTGLEDL